MKKIFYFIVSAIVALGAIACNNEIKENTTPDSEGVSINATIGDLTRIAIGESDIEGYDKKLSWEGDETLTATLNGTVYEFTNTTDAPTTFTCNTEGVKADWAVESADKPVLFFFNDELYQNGEYANYEDKFHLQGYYAPWLADNLVMEFTTVMLHFTCDEEVTIKYTGIFNGITIGVFYGGKKEYTFPAGEHYIGVTAFSDSTLEAWIGGNMAKQTTVSFETGKIYNLGNIEKPAKSEWGVVGSFQGWDVAAPVAMYTTSADGWLIASGIELYKTDEIKLVKGNTWDGSVGFTTAGVAEVDKEHDVVNKNSNNIKSAKNGKFNIYFNPTTSKFKYTCAEEYTGTVNIAINNEANWNPVYITLNKGNETIADKATVSNNVYAISMDYIGESLDYTLTTTGGKSISGKVSITKEGASINLVEKVIKFTFQLDTQNAKDWWGTKAMMHIWNSDASIATSWPGVEMTYDGNYTWHYDIPANLAGTKMQYLIHNGNGWQSSEPTITLSENGHNIKGSSINIK